MAKVEVEYGDGCLIVQALNQMGQDCAKVVETAKDEGDVGGERAFSFARDSWYDLALRFENALDVADELESVS
jgi:hypothetical protein